MYRMKTVYLWMTASRQRSDGTYQYGYIPIIGQSDKTDASQSYFLGTKGRSKQNPVYHEKVVAGEYLLGRAPDGKPIWPIGPIGDYAFQATRHGTVLLRCVPNPVYNNCFLDVSVHGIRLSSNRQEIVYSSYYSITINWQWDGSVATRTDSYKKSGFYKKLPANMRLAFDKLVLSLPLHMTREETKAFTVEKVVSSIQKDMIPVFYQAMALDFFQGNYRKGSSVNVVSADVYPMKSQNFFKEDLRYQGYPVADMSNYWINYATQHAFLDACESAPQLNDNSISNILEITNFIYKLVVKHQIDIPSNLQEAWLAYRYTYNTTKLDTKEAIDFMSRNLPDDIWDVGYKAYGVYTFDYKGVSVTARCTMRMKKREVSMIRDIWISLEKYGLAPDFYVIWDMIPYSFIVDWFIPVGEVLDVVDASAQYTSENYDFGQIVYSLKYSFDAEDGLLHSVYSRWVEDSPPALSGYYWLETNHANNSTIFKRVLDGLSLIL